MRTKKDLTPLFLVMCGRHDEARPYPDKALHLAPEDTSLHACKGELLEIQGDRRGAVAELEQALEHRPDYANVLYSLARIRRPAPGEPLTRRMESLLSRQPQAVDERIKLHFALGAAFDRGGEVGRAFEHFRQGNHLQRGLISYDPEVFKRSAQAFMSRRRSPVASSPRPIFIVGMPRSGSTLVEQILARHSRVGGVGEVTLLEQTGKSLVRRVWQDPAIASHLAARELQRSAEEYLAGLAALAPGVENITDKLLSNYRFLGMIALMFPGACIVHCSRNPLDTCLSCYFQLFFRVDYAFDLMELGRTYRTYRLLMEHWRKVLPLDIHTVCYYETLIKDPEATIRRLIEACGLEWQEHCLEFHVSERNVHTTSSGQVRQPLYSEAVGRWRRYARYLQPLQRALEGSI